MKSIIADYSQGRYCYFTGQSNNLDKHHIFNGPLRAWSEKNGLWIYVEHYKHMDMHVNDQQTLLYLKRIGQRKYEKTHSREEFMSHTHKNYILDDLDTNEGTDLTENWIADYYASMEGGRT